MDLLNLENLKTIGIALTMWDVKIYNAVLPALTALGIALTMWDVKV